MVVPDVDVVLLMELHYHQCAYSFHFGCDGEIVLYCKYFVRYFVSSNSVCCDECLHQSQFEHMLSVNTMFLESSVC